MAKDSVSEGLGFVRFVLVWSSLSPVFLLWAIRGVKAIEDNVWVPICLALFALPTVIIMLFFLNSKKRDNSKTINVSKVRDQSEHLLTYLFAMLIPLFDVNLGGVRDIVAVTFSFAFVMFLFWHMKLHYMNLIFAVFGYRIYTVEAKFAPAIGETTSRQMTFAIISRRHHLPEGELTGYRLGGNVLVDKKDD